MDLFEMEMAAAKVPQLEAENARLREELAQAQATIERSVDDGIDKIMAMSDDQIKALCSFSGHHPDDEARIGRLCGEVALLKNQLTASQLDAARYRWLRNDPPLTLAVRRFPADTERGCYLDGSNLDKAIDSAMKGEQS